MIGARIQRQQIRADFKPDFDVRAKSDIDLLFWPGSIFDLARGRTVSYGVGGKETISDKGRAWRVAATSGANAYVDTAIVGSRAFTYLAVVKFNTLTGTTFSGVSGNDTGAVICSQRELSTDVSATFCISNASTSGSTVMGLWLGIDGSGTVRGRKGGTTITTGRWYALAGTFDPAEGFPGGFHVYVDGQLDDAATANIGTTTSFSGSRTRFGGNNQWPTAANDDADVEIAYVARIPRALNAAEIAEWARNPFEYAAEPEQSSATVFFAAGGTTKTLTDTGSGMDALAIAVAFGLADTGAGNDAAPGASAGLSLADTAASADIVSQIAAALTLPDTLTGTEALSLAALLGVADSGQGLDAVGSVAVSFALADLGAGADAVGLLQELLKTIADAGQGTDAVASITVTVPAIADTGAGADTVTLTTEALKTIADAGTGADAVAQMLVLAAIAETGAGLDQATTGVQLSLADAGSGLDPGDGLTVSVSVPIPDAGSGLDALGPITALLALLDTVNATDVVIRIGEEFKQIVSIRFTFAARRVVFAWSARSVSFKLN